MAKEGAALSYHANLYLLSEVLRMFNRGDQRRDLETEGLRGILTKERCIRITGCFACQQYRAVIETDDGEATLSLLVRAYIDPRKN